MATPQTIDPQLPRLTAKDVQAFADPTSVKRGEGYHRRGMIYHTVRRGGTLSASCHGSSGGPYEVRLTLAMSANRKIERWNCTCPLGTFCKHIVALALTWIENPEQFAVGRTVDEILAEQDRAGLIAIIQRMIMLDPALESVLEKMIPPAPIEIPPAKPGDAGIVTVKLDTIRSRLEDALDANRDVYSDDYRWGDHDYDSEKFELLAIERIESEFSEAVEIGERYEDAGRYADAAAVFALVATIGVERFDDTYENDLVFNAIFDAGRGLVRCLQQQPSLPEGDRLRLQERTLLIDTIYEIWCFAGHGQWGDDERGVPDSDEEVAELAESQPDVALVLSAIVDDAERELIDHRWRSQAGDAGSPDWRRRSAIAFGSVFSGEELSDDERLAMIVAAELWWDQAMFLLDQGKTAEATAVAMRKLIAPQEAVLFAHELTERGGDGLQRAIQFIDERLWETEGKKPTDDLIYRNWLAGAYVRSGDPKLAIEAKFRLFELNPYFGSYKELQKLVQSSSGDPDRWAEMRAKAMTALTTTGNRTAIMEIYLEEGNAHEALTLLKDTSKPDREKLLSSRMAWTWNVQGFQDKVAKLAEKDFPDDALKIYRNLVAELIARKNRSSYRSALGYLKSIKQILQANNRGDEWQELIRSIRKDNPTLRALQDELDKAGF